MPAAFKVTDFGALNKRKNCASLSKLQKTKKVIPIAKVKYVKL